MQPPRRISAAVRPPVALASVAGPCRERRTVAHGRRPRSSSRAPRQLCAALGIAARVVGPECSLGGRPRNESDRLPRSNANTSWPAACSNPSIAPALFPLPAGGARGGFRLGTIAALHPIFNPAPNEERSSATNATKTAKRSGSSSCVKARQRARASKFPTFAGRASTAHCASAHVSAASARGWACTLCGARRGELRAS